MLDMMIKLRYAFLCAKLNNSKQDLSISYINFRDPDTRIQELESLLERKDEEIGRLKQKIEVDRLGIQRFSNDDSMMKFYTGFTSMAMFLALFDYVKPAANCMTGYYYKASDKQTQQISVGKQRNRLLIDELFFFFMQTEMWSYSSRFSCQIQLSFVNS